jgi:flavin-dependent dehydrogenase
MHVGGGGYCGLAPLSASCADVAFVLDRRELAAAAGDPETFYHGTLGRWPRLAERLEPPRGIGPLALGARHVSAPGALPVGDSAGSFDPFTGEGVTLALRSAELAAEVAHRALAHRGLDDLSVYDRVRKAATRDKLGFNRLVQRIVACPGSRTLWPAAFPAVPTSPPPGRHRRRLRPRAFDGRPPVPRRPPPLPRERDRPLSVVAEAGIPWRTAQHWLMWRQLWWPWYEKSGPLRVSEMSHNSVWRASQEWTGTPK